MSDFVLNDTNDDSDEEEENRRESGRGCGTSEEEEEEEKKKKKKENEKKQKKDANGRKENESTAGFKVYSKPMPKRLRRVLRCARQPEVMEAVSDFIAIGVMKSVQRANEIEIRSSLAPNSSSNDGGVSFSSGVRGVEQKMADFVSRVTETVLKTEESASRFNSIFTNCVESLASATKKALMIGGGGGRNGDGDGESLSSYEAVVDLAMRKIEKRKKFLFDLIDVGVRSFVSENQRNEANPFNDVIKALETNPRIGFKLIDSVATKVVETYVAETHKSGFVSEMARQSNKRRGPRSRGSIADLPAEEFRASASFAMEKRLSLGEDQEGQGTKKKSGSPKTPLERTLAQQIRRKEGGNEIDEEDEETTESHAEGDILDQTPRFDGLPPRRPSNTNLTEQHPTTATTTTGGGGGNFRTFEGELAKDLFDVVRATPNSRKFAVEMATQCVRSAMSAIVFALVDVARVELRKASKGIYDWIQTGPEFDGVIDIRTVWAKRMVFLAIFLLVIRIAWNYGVGYDVLS